MFRKMLSLVLALSLVLCVFATTSNAAPRWDSLRDRQARYAEQQLYRMVDDANRRIDRAISWAQMTPYNDINWLQWQVSLITAPVFAYGRLIGVTVICEYDTYYIDGQYVEVDPLRVINV